MRTALSISMALFLLIAASCGNSGNGELTRDLAKEILNKKLAAQKYSHITWITGAFPVAIKDGIMVEDDTVSPPCFRFTASGLKMAGGVLTDKGNYIDIPPFGVQWDTMQYMGFDLNIRESVEDVTGITDESPTIRRVEYSTSLGFTPEMRPLLKYLYSRMRRVAVFQKYDDGWRIMPEQ